MSNPHYFIGIRLKENLQEKLEVIQQQLDLGQYYRRVTHFKDFHITLSFIGELSEEQVVQLIEQLSTIAFPSFPLQLTAISGFGDNRPPRVLYMGVKNEQRLMDLEQQVWDVTKEFQADRKSPFIPHITLAKRSKGNDDVQFTGKLSEEFLVTSFELYRVNKGQRPSYEPLKWFAASGGKDK